MTSSEELEREQMPDTLDDGCLAPLSCDQPSAVETKRNVPSWQENVRT